MKFEKEQMTKDVWMVELVGKRIPLEALTAILKSVALSVLIVLAYNMGQYNASEYLKWNSYFNGNFDPITKTYSICWVEQSGMSVAWECEQKNETVKNIIPVNPA